jgi:hypothetical protein
MKTLNEFFLPRPADFSERLTRALDDRDALEPFDEKVPSSKISVMLRMMPGKVEEYLHEMLQVDLVDVLAGGWNKAREIRKQLEKSASAPGKDFFVQLAEHKISSAHRPVLELSTAGKKVARLPFPTSLELELRGIVLHIRDGAIQRVQTGRLLGKGVVKCGKAVLVERELKTIDMVGSFDLRPSAGDSKSHAPR